MEDRVRGTRDAAVAQEEWFVGSVTAHVHEPCFATRATGHAVHRDNLATGLVRDPPDDVVWQAQRGLWHSSTEANSRARRRYSGAHANQVGGERWPSSRSSTPTVTCSSRRRCGTRTCHRVTKVWRGPRSGTSRT